MIEEQFAVGFDGNGVGGFELGEDLLAAFAGRDVRLALRHFFGIEQTLVIGGEGFGVEAVTGVVAVWGAGRAEAAGERLVEILFAVVTRHRGLLS